MAIKKGMPNPVKAKTQTKAEKGLNKDTPMKLKKADEKLDKMFKVKEGSAKDRKKDAVLNKLNSKKY
jgi:hypothetical protein